MRFVDDGLATNVLPTIAALAAFAGERVALLVGGFDRGIDYGPLAEAVAAFVGELLVVTMPDNGDRIADALAGAGVAAEVRPAADLDAAVAAAFAWADPAAWCCCLRPRPASGASGTTATAARRFARAMGACRE